jgi:D-alanyl-D-alanine carboxypeptidase/D-alanyl-D-alanine-endopeptidase (penicillin-binding protein 4)
MFRVLQLVFIGLILAFSNLVAWSSGTIAQNDSGLYQEIKRLFKEQGERDLNAGIYIKNLTDGSVKFAYHPHRFFAPASVVKIFTAYEALSYLDPDYRFETVLLSKKEAKDGVLKASLYIKFSGDPTFTYQDLKTMLEGMKAKEIAGDIVIDGTLFDDQHTAPGGFTWDDRPFYYAAPSSAIIINKNCSEAKMSPALKAGTKAKLRINDPTVLQIENNVDTVSPGLECPYKSRYLGENKYEVYGCMFKSSKPEDIRLNFALQDNNLMARTYVVNALKELGIKLKGQIKFAGAGAGLTTLYAHKSPPLTEILKDVLEDSCNLSAASIFKHIAARHTKQQASHESGVSVMKSLLKKDGLEDFVIADGAGESRYNLVTPQAAVHLLELAYKKPKVKDLFIEALAKYGSEGTLKFRTLGTELNKYTYGKTGTLSGVSTLAGYYLPPKGPKYAFAIFVNNHMIPVDKIRLLEDKILSTLLK